MANNLASLAQPLSQLTITLVYLFTCSAHQAMAQQAEKIEAASILEHWTDSRVANVKVGLVHTTRYHQDLKILEMQPSLDPNFQDGQAVREKEFYYTHDVGMRNSTVAGIVRDVAILDGEGISILGPGTAEYSPYTVEIYENGQGSPIMADSVTGWFLLWFDPTQAKIASDISEGSVSSFTLRSDSDWGTVAVGQVTGKDTEESFVLAKQFDWRPVRIDMNRFGQPASRIEID